MKNSLDTSYGTDRTVTHFKNVHFCWVIGTNLLREYRILSGKLKNCIDDISRSLVEHISRGCAKDRYMVRYLLALHEYIEFTFDCKIMDTSHFCHWERSVIVPLHNKASVVLFVLIVLFRNVTHRRTHFFFPLQTGCMSHPSSNWLNGTILNRMIDSSNIYQYSWVNQQVSTQ